MATPRYPKTNGDDLRELRQGVLEAQTAAQNRVQFLKTSKGLNLLNLPGDPPAPADGVIFYAKAGRAYYRSSSGTVYGPL